MTTEIPDFPFKRSAFAPPAEYAAFRATAPVARIRMADGALGWLITRHDLVRQVLSDSRFSTNPLTPGYPALTLGRVELLKAEIPQTFIRMDPPKHGEVRRMFTREFTFARINEMRPRVEAIVEEHLDLLSARGEPIDFFAEFAVPFPTTVTSDFLGIPKEDHLFFQERSRTRVAIDLGPEAPIDAVRQMRARVNEILVERMSGYEDRSDLIGRMLADHVLPGHMTRDEAAATLELLMMAGHETTANMLTLGLLSMLLEPAGLGTLAGDEAAIRNAVEEMLRFHSIVQYNGLRVALDDCEVGGVTIRKGEGVLALIAAANRDPGIFPDPDCFDPSRDATGHVGFSYGPHLCLGQGLARLEMRVAFARLADRFPNMHLAVPVEELVFRYGSLVHGVDALPVAWSSRA